MDKRESEFWAALEFRICTEFSGFKLQKDGAIHHYWCDGLVPDEYDLQSDEPCIHGRVYCGHDGQEQWRFTLLTRNGVTASAEVD